MKTYPTMKLSPGILSDLTIVLEMIKDDARPIQLRSAAEMLKNIAELIDNEVTAKHYRDEASNLFGITGR